MPVRKHGWRVFHSCWILKGRSREDSAMKKERYFRDELRRMLIGYAVIPAFFITLVCGLVFMAALLYGKMNGGQMLGKTAAQELESLLSSYQEGMEILGNKPWLFDPENQEERARIFEEFYHIAGQAGYEADLLVLDSEGRVVLSNGQEETSSLITDPAIDWGIAGAMKKAPNQTVMRFMNGWLEGESKIVLGREVRDGTVLRGYLVFAIDESPFQKLLARSDTQTIIADRFGWVFFSNNYPFLNESNQINPILKTAGRFFTFENRLYSLAKREACEGQFFIYAVSDVQNLITALSAGGILIVTVLILMTVWILMNSRRVMDRKTRDLYRVLDGMRMAEDGNLGSTIQVEDTNEFRFIAEAYNGMMAGLKRQMENNRRMTELVAVSQNKQLESQFNPHFLYNTLENIRYMVKLEPEIAQKMIVSLSGLLRYSMDGNKEEVTLGEDLEHLEHYLTILKYRYNDRLSYLIDVEPEAVDCLIPKLVLQPLIENAVKYGYGNRKKLEVELKAYIHEEKLIMICWDDGAGMTPGTLKELTQLLGEEENKSRHSGLYNIHRRIGILYGRPYGVEIRSTEGHGTTLIVTLPGHKGETG